MEIYGIDVSVYNRVLDYEKVAKAGKKYAIMRITERGNVTDRSFEKNYQGFSKVGMKKGVYKYCYALQVEQAREEAQKVLEVLGGRELEFPVFYDVEWSQLRALPQNQITAIIKAFRQVILNGGYPFGIYCNGDWYKNVLKVDSLPYDYWLASYPYEDQGQIVEALRPKAGIGWQYSSKGKVPGIEGDVDMDVFYQNQFEKPEEGYTIWVGACTGNMVYVRSGPGTEYAPIKEYPYLEKGNLMDVVGEEENPQGELWYQVIIAGKYWGYMFSNYIKKV